MLSAAPYWWHALGSGDRRGRGWNVGEVVRYVGTRILSEFSIKTELDIHKITHWRSLAQKDMFSCIKLFEFLVTLNSQQIQQQDVLMTHLFWKKVIMTSKKSWKIYVNSVCYDATFHPNVRSSCTLSYRVTVPHCTSHHAAAAALNIPGSSAHNLSESCPSLGASWMWGEWCFIFHSVKIMQIYFFHLNMYTMK